jgi:hypothetical protein
MKLRSEVSYEKVWIITISLRSDKCPINCAVARTLANNDRPAFQNLHSIDKLSIAINLIARADHFSHDQSHYT